MRMLTAGAYSIAWFKLADFVIRGEKERALSVQRLLMHSVQDAALAYQLEGDILLAFDDDASLEKYHVAATLYKQAGKLQQAISVYKHASLFKENEKILQSLLDMYCAMNNKVGILDTFSRLAKVCLVKNNTSHLLNIFSDYLAQSNISIQAQLSARLVRALMLYDSKNSHIAMHIHQTADLFHQALEIGELASMDLQKFLSELKSLDDEHHKKAQQYVSAHARLS